MPKRKSRAGKGWTPQSAAGLLRGINPSTLNSRGRALLKSAIARNAATKSQAVPKVSDVVKRVAGSQKGQGSIPRSARPVGPVRRASSQAASMVSGSNVSQTIRQATAKPAKRRVAKTIKRKASNRRPVRR